MSHDAAHDRRVALSVTTVGILAATLNASILLISLPAIFDGLGLNPLAPANISYLLWMLMGYLLVTAVLVVTFGRLGDQYGRAKLFNLGFLIFTVASVACALVPNSGSAGALELIALRIVQGIGGAMLTANSTAIITDAFPPDRRGFALGVNQVAGIGGSFVGLVVGGLLAEWHWRAVFWVSVPVGIWGTWMGYRTLRDKPRDRRDGVAIDWWGNLTFGIGLIAILIAITYGLQPYGGHTMGWTSPKVLTGLIGGVALLVVFGFIELRVDEPMMDLKLFKIRAFAAGQTVNLLASMAPRWPAVHADHLVAGHLVAAARLRLRQHPAVGRHLHAAVDHRVPDRRPGLRRAVRPAGRPHLRHRWAAADRGHLRRADPIPADFNYPLFAALLALNGIGMGLMAAPNSAAIMNAVPAAERGAASGIRATGMNAGMVLSMGGFFTLMAVGLASRLPDSMYNGLTSWASPRTPRTPSRTPRRSAPCSPRSSATTRSRRCCRTRSRMRTPR